MRRGACNLLRNVSKSLISTGSLFCPEMSVIAFLLHQLREWSKSLPRNRSPRDRPTQVRTDNIQVSQYLTLAFIEAQVCDLQHVQPCPSPPRGYAGKFQ